MALARQARREPLPKARASLSRDRILDAAMGLALRSPEPLSLSRLGRALEADPTAVYRHFRSRDELVLAMSERVHAEVCADLLAIPAGQSWRDQIAVHASILRSGFLRYPALAHECAHRVTGGANEARGARWMIDRLTGAGFGPAEAGRALVLDGRRPGEPQAPAYPLPQEPGDDRRPAVRRARPARVPLLTERGRRSHSICGSRKRPGRGRARRGRRRTVG